ncbi:TPA: Ig-like domain-containing protein, partial [Salmonella enterica]|nr:Ig-like domain-containing protein [Salmonella enterica]
ANGTDAFTWNALVTDQYGNKVKNADVTWSTDTAGTPPTPTTSQTGATGEASTTLVSATAVSNVHMQAKTAVQQTPFTSPVGVSFVVRGAATITGTVTTDNSVADGATADVVTIAVTDPTGNPVTGVDLTADLSKSNGVQTTDGKTTRALDTAGKATFSFTSTVAGTHSIAFSVPDSANAKAGAGTVSITFVAGPVDAAQSEVTVPVGAAVQGDPLELHLYARDANGKDVSVTDQGSNNVVIAATGTGVTLTATPQGEGDDNDGHYWKYSLVPDTASYATQAIRYNTVTVEVNGAKVGSQYQAEWSPDVVLGGGDSLPYSMDEVKEIIRTCNDPILVLPENGHANMRVFTSAPAGSRLKCGYDPATMLQPAVVMQNLAAPTAATIHVTLSKDGSGYYRAPAPLTAPAPGGSQDVSTSVGTTYTYAVTATGGVPGPAGVTVTDGYPSTPELTDKVNGLPAGYTASRPAVTLSNDGTSPTGAAGCLRNCSFTEDTGSAGLWYARANDEGIVRIVDRVSVTSKGDVSLEYSQGGVRVWFTAYSVHIMPGENVDGTLGATVCIVGDTSKASAVWPSLAGEVLASTLGTTAYSLYGGCPTTRAGVVHRTITDGEIYNQQSVPTLTSPAYLYLGVR